MGIGSPIARSQHDFRSVGAGSARINDESTIYKTKDLQSVTVPTLPNDAAQFRGWRNSFLTKAASIDKTGENRIMTWLLESFSAEVSVEYLEQTSLEMPRFDAYLASQLMEPKHLRGELGLQFQAYAEKEQMRGRAPLGRVLLNMVARRFFLDLSRGANLTQQSLLELDIGSYTYEGLRTFVDRIEFVLNSIPPELQPSELTRYTWLYSRLKKVRMMQRHIDRIKDSRQNSHVRCWEWLFNKLKTTLLEMKEDQNEESIRTALQSQAKAKPKPKGTVAQTGEGEEASQSAAAAKAKPKAKPKPKPSNSPKGSSKGKDDGQGAPSKSDSKGKGTGKDDAKGKAKPKPDTKSVPCIFWPKGTCNRGSECPFYHDPKVAPKASAAAAKNAPTNPKGGASGGSASSNAAAKATVATVVASSLSKASASEVRSDRDCATSIFDRFKHIAIACVRPFQSFFKCFAALTCLTTNVQQVSEGALAYASSGASQGLPAVLSYQHAMIAQHDERGVYEISWIADSGAGRDLASLKAFQDQGIPKQSLNQFLQNTQRVKFETGNGCVNSDTSITANGSKFGDAAFHVMQSCPLVRSLGQIVESGRPFVWLPGELPFFGLDSDAIQLAADSERLLVADKVDDHVPIFSETMQFETPYAFGLPAVDAVPEGEPPVVVPADPEVPAIDGPEGDADSEDGDQDPKDRYARLLQDAASVEHKRLHIPKNPTCEICQRSRMYRRRTNSKRHDPLESRGMLPEVTAFGERLACDFIIVSKSRTEGRDNVVLVVRDEFSGFVRAFPLGSRSSENINKHLLAFLGPSYYKQPSIMVKSDQAHEFQASCSQLGFQHEPTLENRWPHNARLERELRTIEEITRAVHLQAGFHLFQDLWPLSVSHAAFMISCFHKTPGAEVTRLELATGKPWTGRDILLGQLVYVRDLNQQKFQANAKPAIFAGYRLDTGPHFKGVHLVLDYKSLQDRSPGFNVPTSIPFEEVFIPEGDPVMPLFTASQAALAEFGGLKLENVPNIDVPFSSLPSSATPKERNEYITLDRLIRYGPSPGCKACEKAGGSHTAACRARFTGLIRADKIAADGRHGSPLSPAASMPPTPALPPSSVAPMTPSLPPVDVERPIVEVVEERVDPSSLPFSAGIPPGSEEAEAMIGKVNQDIDAAFIDDNIARGKARRLNDLKGKDMLFEYACSDDSIIGQKAEQLDIKVVRLTRSLLDLEKSSDVEQAIGQLEQVPGADAYVSLTCTFFSPLQHLNVAIHGEQYEMKLNKSRKKTINMLNLAIKFLEVAIKNHGRIAVEWPRSSGLWETKEWIAFMKRFNLKYVHFDGCSLGLKGRNQFYLKKPWCIATNDLRVLQYYGQHQCPGNHQHEPTQGANATLSAYYTPEFAEVLLEALYPKQSFKFVPDVSETSSAFVTRNLSRSEWLQDPKGLKAVLDEAQGLRGNRTWDDGSVTTLENLKNQAKQLGITVHIASLHTLCGVKHWEQPIEKHKYKGRIVYRGDLIRNESDELVLYADTATTPTALVALNLALFFGACEHNSISLSDAVQAFLQAPLEEETWVLVPFELWLDNWKTQYPKGSKLCVRLLKSLYGHPLAGKLWQSYLSERLTKLGGVESEIYPSNWFFRRNGHTLLLNIYVDDLTLCGRSHLHSSFWKELREHVKLEPEVHINEVGSLILGRTHKLFKREGEAELHFEMTSYAQSIVQFYCELCGISETSLKAVPSPALPESNMSDEEADEQGMLHKDAAKALMRLLWLSRLSRPDISFIVGRLASNVSRWSRWDDRQLHRLVSYIHHTHTHRCYGKVSYSHGPVVRAYSDSDFASCPWTAKSTSGIVIGVQTGEAFFPLFWQSKKQSSVARSASEAESIALAATLFGETLHIQEMLERLFEISIPIYLEQDNEAVIRILQSGYSVKLRHCNRVHRVNIASICDLLEKEEKLNLRYCHTKLQLANALTKILPPIQWNEALEQLCVKPT